MYEIDAKDLPTAYIQSVDKDTNQVTCVTSRLILSSETDFAFVMDNLVTPIINQLPKNSGIQPSTVDHLLAITGPDHKCKVYVNELGLRTSVRSKSSVRKGQVVYSEQIADVERLEFHGVEIPADAGVVVVLSHQWGKSLFFDTGPIMEGDKNKRDFDIGEVLGQCQNRMLFQHLYEITAEQWETLFQQRWFPFMGLKHQTMKLMRRYLDSGGNCDDLLDDIVAEVKAGLPGWIKSWESRPSFANHMGFISRAAERFMEKDYISSISILYPRIEGVLRSIAPNQGDSRLHQSKLAKSALEASGISTRAFSALLPEAFSEYLEKVFFADFQPDETPPMSRNAVVHGAAREEQFSEKEAVIAFLILHQIFYHHPRKTT
ncbi:MAG: hypothetical protein MPK31_03885 [Gammaproteobacteria bacterium]|nr:hypothetical protein [Gammaproteobacteria bacterium]MDA8002847.1 hypothetical protein [Alphaproteobacteria bacterium]